MTESGEKVGSKGLWAYFPEEELDVLAELLAVAAATDRSPSEVARAAIAVGLKDPNVRQNAPQKVIGEMKEIAKVVLRRLGRRYVSKDVVERIRGAHMAKYGHEGP